MTIVQKKNVYKKIKLTQKIKYKIKQMAQKMFYCPFFGVKLPVSRYN